MDPKTSSNRPDQAAQTQQEPNAIIDTSALVPVGAIGSVPPTGSPELGARGWPADGAPPRDPTRRHPVLTPVPFDVTGPTALVMTLTTAGSTIAVGRLKRVRVQQGPATQPLVARDRGVVRPRHRLVRELTRGRWFPFFRHAEILIPAPPTAPAGSPQPAVTEPIPVLPATPNGSLAAPGWSVPLWTAATPAGSRVPSGGTDRPVPAALVRPFDPPPGSTAPIGPSGPAGPIGPTGPTGPTGPAHGGGGAAVPEARGNSPTAPSDLPGTGGNPPAGGGADGDDGGGGTGGNGDDGAGGSDPGAGGEPPDPLVPLLPLDGPLVAVDQRIAVDQDIELTMADAAGAPAIRVDLAQSADTVQHAVIIDDDGGLTTFGSSQDAEISVLMRVARTAPIGLPSDRPAGGATEYQLRSHQHLDVAHSLDFAVPRGDDGAAIIQIDQTIAFDDRLLVRTDQADPAPLAAQIGQSVYAYQTADATAESAPASPSSDDGTGSALDLDNRVGHALSLLITLHRDHAGLVVKVAVISQARMGQDAAAGLTDPVAGEAIADADQTLAAESWVLVELVLDDDPEATLQVRLSQEALMTQTLGLALLPNPAETDALVGMVEQTLRVSHAGVVDLDFRETDHGLQITVAAVETTTIAAETGITIRTDDETHATELGDAATLGQMVTFGTEAARTNGFDLDLWLDRDAYLGQNAGILITSSGNQPTIQVLTDQNAILDPEALAEFDPARLSEQSH